MYTEETGNGFLSRLKNVFHRTAASEGETLSSAMGTITTEFYPTDETPKSITETFEQEPEPVYESVTEKEITLRTVEVSAPTYKLPVEKDLDIRFATSFSAVGGKFIFCETLHEAIENMRMLKLENRWQHIFCWENEIKDAFANCNFQKGSVGFTIGNSDAAISLCETLVADDGTIILNPKQASRRRLPCFPKTHIILTDTAHLIGSEFEGLEKFYKLHKGELPSIIKLGTCNNGHFYDKQRLILNAEGPEDIYVFLVDEIIPPSLRP